MNYHLIQTDDMNNGEGLRTTLFVSGCSHRCKGCQNPQTWDSDSGFVFDNKSYKELMCCISKDYISGLTLTGGDPLYEQNVHDIYNIVQDIKAMFPHKTIWIYTGYTFEDIFNNNDEVYKVRQDIVRLCDVMVDGKYQEELRDVSYHWAGSTNQRVIDIQKSLKENKIFLHE